MSQSQEATLAVRPQRQTVFASEAARSAARTRGARAARGAVLEATQLQSCTSRRCERTASTTAVRLVALQDVQLEYDMAHVRLDGALTEHQPMPARGPSGTITPLARAFAVERVKRIEFAWPAWKVALGVRTSAFPASGACPGNTVNDRLSPCLMVRQWAHVGYANLRRLQQRAVRHLRALTGLRGFVAIVANPTSGSSKPDRTRASRPWLPGSVNRRRPTAV